MACASLDIEYRMLSVRELLELLSFVVMDML